MWSEGLEPIRETLVKYLPTSTRISLRRTEKKIERRITSDYESILNYIQIFRTHLEEINLSEKPPDDVKMGDPILWNLNDEFAEAWLHLILPSSGKSKRCCHGRKNSDGSSGCISFT